MKGFIAIVLILLARTSLGQNIVFADMISLLSKPNWESVNQSLINKGWSYYSSGEGTNDKYATIEWSYGQATYDDRARAWMRLYTDDDKPASLSFQFHTKSIYNLFITSIKNAGYEKTSSEIQDNGLVVRYASKNYVATVLTSKSKDYVYGSQAIYNVTLRKKSDIEIYLSTPRRSNLKDLNSDGIQPTTRKNGIFKEYDSDNNVTGEYIYKNNVLHGMYKRYENGEIVETGTYVNGVKTGKYKTFENGKLDVEGFFKNGSPNGVHVFYYYDEITGELNVKSTGLFVNEKRQGLWKDLVDVGGKSIAFQYFTYKDDILHGAFKRVDGNEIAIGTYKNSELHGSYKLYVDINTEEGELILDISKAYLKEEGFYENGLQVGKWKYYDEEKRMIEEATYVEGIKQ